MNAWTNLRLAMIQADLADRRNDAALQRAAAPVRATRPAIVPTQDPRSNPPITGWPISAASRS